MTQNAEPQGGAADKPEWNDAMKEIGGIVGSDHVILDPSQVRERSQDIIPRTHLASAFVYPGSVEEIQSILQVARRRHLTLWPTSRGKNWGYGGASPSEPGAVVLVLERMNRILEVNRELAYAVVEPGVSFRQLHSHLQTQGIPLWLDCTDGPADGSVVGNSLERGVGETNYGDHFGNVCGMEVLLPDGSLVRTGGGPMENYASWNTYKWGVGPYLEGLFSQSNFGIVTKMGIWLMPKPPAFETVVFETKSEAAFPMVIDALRRLQLNGAIASKVHMINRTVSLAIAGSERLSIAPWVFAAGLYGTARQIRADKALIRKELSSLGRLTFIGRRTVSVLEWVLKAADPDRPGAAWVRKGLEFVFRKPIQLIESLPHIASIERGEPSDYFVKHAYFKSARPRPRDGAVDPVRDRCGMVWLGPMVPLVGERLNGFLEECRKIYDRHNSPFYVALMVANARTVIALFAVYFDKDQPKEVENAHALYRELGAATQAAGYQQYRTSTAYMDKILEPAPAFQSLARRIKSALDPDQIIAKGKYGI